MKKNIAIVAGGDSSEIVISLKSADGIYSFIDKDKYNLYIAIVKRDEWAVILPSGEHTPIDKNDFSFKENGVTRHFDFAYITIHGTPGEDGRLQGYFDMIGMPYSFIQGRDYYGRRSRDSFGFAYFRETKRWG